MSQGQIFLIEGTLAAKDSLSSICWRDCISSSAMWAADRRVIAGREGHRSTIRSQEVRLLPLIQFDYCVGAVGCVGFYRHLRCSQVI